MKYIFVIAVVIAAAMGISILNTLQPSKPPLTHTQPADETTFSNEDAMQPIEPKALLSEAAAPSVKQHNIAEQKVASISKLPISSPHAFSEEFVSTEDGKEFVSKKALDDVLKMILHYCCNACLKLNTLKSPKYVKIS